MLLVNAVLSALLNLVLLAGLPFLLYFTYQKTRRKRGFGETARRAGLQLCERRYLGFSLAFALASVVGLLVWPPPLEPLMRPRSPQRAFVGLGLGGPAIPMALLYGVVKTGFPEELLFRGLIAGSLSRRLSLGWANFSQAVVFLVPHVFAVVVMPEMWGLLPLVFASSLFLGWLRIRSGSIVGPWLIHAASNVVTCLSVAVRTAV